MNQRGLARHFWQTSAREAECACGDGIRTGSPAMTTAWRGAPVLPAVALVLLPKCPACLLAWAGVLGTWGAAHHSGLPPGTLIASVLATAAIGAVTVRAIRTRRPATAIVAGVAAVAVLSAKFLVDSPPLLYGAALVLILASTARIVRRGADGCH